MKSPNNPAFSPSTAITVKVVGIILTLTSLLNYIVVAIPFNPQQRSWQLNFTNQLVDRGILPMVGIALIVAGVWIGNIARGSEPDGQRWQDLRFWAFLLSSLLGLIFLLLLPLHLSNVYAESTQALTQIREKATQEEQSIAGRAKQLQALAKDPQQLKQLDEAIRSGKIEGQQLAQLQGLQQQLQQVQQNPDAINKEIEASRSQIAKERQQAESQTQTAAWRVAVQTGLTGLLLALGYIAIGWTGLRGLLNSQGYRRQSDRW